MANDELFYSDEIASNTLLIQHTIEYGSPNMCVWEREGLDARLRSVNSLQMASIVRWGSGSSIA